MLLRQWQLVQAMHGRRRGLRPRELMEAVDTTRQTLYRDLSTLQEAGVPIAVERVNGEARYALLGEPLPALGPSGLELAALRLARTMLAPLDGTQLVDALDGLLARFGARPAGGSPIAMRSAPDAGESHRTVVSAADAALRSGRRLQLDYRDAAGRDTTERIVDPVALRYAGDHLYLVAWDIERGDWRVFKILRMQRARILADEAGAHPDYDEDALFRGSVKTWRGEPVDVVVRLSPDVAWKVDEWPLVPEQRIEPQAGGAVIVRARVQGIVEATRWVLSWGPAAEALEPPSLRTQVEEQLRGALQLYAGSPVRGPARARSPSRASDGAGRRAGGADTGTADGSR